MPTSSRVMETAKPLPSLPRHFLHYISPNSTRRAISDSRPTLNKHVHASQLPPTLGPAWHNGASGYMDMPRRGQATGPRDLPPQGLPPLVPLPLPQLSRPLRRAPDSQRIKTRHLEKDTIKAVKHEFRNKDNDIDAHIAAYDAAVAAEIEQEALDLAMNARQETINRTTSIASTQAPTVSSRPKNWSRGDSLLPEFKIVQGEETMTPEQDVPCSPHAPFEWDELYGPTSSPTRAASVSDYQSKSRQISRPELQIDLARKQRPATLPERERKPSLKRHSVRRMGVILDPTIVHKEMDRRWGGQKI